MLTVKQQLQKETLCCKPGCKLLSERSPAGVQKRRDCRFEKNFLPENSLILTESAYQTEVSLSKRLHLTVSEVIKQQL